MLMFLLTSATADWTKKQGKRQDKQNKGNENGQSVYQGRP